MSMHDGARSHSLQIALNSNDDKLNIGEDRDDVVQEEELHGSESSRLRDNDPSSHLYIKQDRLKHGNNFPNKNVSFAGAEAKLMLSITQTNNNTSTTTSTTTGTTGMNILTHTKRDTSTCGPLPQCCHKEKPRSGDERSLLLSSNNSAHLLINSEKMKLDDDERNSEITVKHYCGSGTTMSFGGPKSSLSKVCPNGNNNQRPQGSVMEENGIQGYNLQKREEDDDKAQTLKQIITYLKNGTRDLVQDELDEDEMVTTITKMNVASRRRHRHKWLLQQKVKKYTHQQDYQSDPDDYWNDNDIKTDTEILQAILPASGTEKRYHHDDSNEKYNQMAINAMINIVDGKFFSRIINKIEESSECVLNDAVITSLQNSLVIPKNKVRRRRDFIMTLPVGDDHDENQKAQQNGEGNQDCTSNNTQQENKLCKNICDSESSKECKKFFEVEEIPVSNTYENVVRAENRLQTRRMTQQSIAKQRNECDERNSREMSGLISLIAAMVEIEENEGRSVNIDFDNVVLQQGRKLRSRNKTALRENSKKQYNSSPIRSDVENSARSGGKRRKKNTSPLHQWTKFQKLDSDGLYAVLPVNQGKKNNFSEQSIGQKVVRISSIVVDGSSLEVIDEGKGGEDETPKKRSYKKRQPYVKRGPYKRRKKAKDEIRSDEPSDDSVHCIKEKTKSVHKVTNDEENIDISINSPESKFDSKDSHPVSPELLDWQRRQKWAKDIDQSEKEMKNSVCEGEALIFPPGIDVSMLGWGRMNQYVEGDPIKAPTMEPPRERHSNHTYGRACSRLLNSLQSKGRVFAHHEFFYSDIDKAWFNENLLGADLEKAGVPPDSRLTKTEWSMLRRKFCRRPRLFSTNFITSQLHQLQQYRKSVRAIQTQGAESATAKDFGFKVLARPKVGTTVTALSARCCMIHRGIVLAHNQEKASYLVQFERKELGWEWVADIEIATHGVPEILLPKHDNVKLLTHSRCAESDSEHNIADRGSLPQGTMFIPFLEVFKGEKEFSAKKPQSLPSNIGTGVSKVSHSQLSNLLNRAGEREALVKMMDLIEATLERKKAILDGMNELHKMFYEKKSCVLSHFEKDNCKSYYIWLQENLKSTERALQHQQVMYRKIYADQAVKPPTTSTKHERALPASNEGKKWHRMICQGTEEIASALAAKSFEECSIRQNPCVERGDRVFSGKKQRDNILHNRVSSAAEVLLTGDLISGLSPSDNVTKTMMHTLKLLTNLKLPRLPLEIIDTIHSRNAALSDLIEGMEMLNSELVMSNQQ